MINNTFVRNRTGIRLGRFSDFTKIYRNNILVQNDTGVEVDPGLVIPMPGVWTNNLVFDSTIANYSSALTDPTGTNGNIAVSPSFANQAGGNYHLQPGSLAIGAGSPSGAPATDFDGWRAGHRSTSGPLKDLKQVGVKLRSYLVRTMRAP